MSKTRVFYRSQSSFECHVFDGNKLLLHAVFYPGKSYGCPRYHFENFALQLPDLNYELRRFFNAVTAVITKPFIKDDDLDSALDNDLTLFV